MITVGVGTKTQFSEATDSKPLATPSPEMQAATAAPAIARIITAVLWAMERRLLNAIISPNRLESLAAPLSAISTIAARNGRLAREYAFKNLKADADSPMPDICPSNHPVIGKIVWPIKRVMKMAAPALNLFG